MEIPLYLAMTATEIRNHKPLPQHLAWLSILFSPYGRGLSNIPRELPPNSLLILSDRTPIQGHDPNLILETLTDVVQMFSCCGVLLDFERSPGEEATVLADTLSALPCPVGIPAAYAHSIKCPVFVPAPSPSADLAAYLAPWSGREIWLEVSAQAETYTVSADSATVKSSLPPLHLPHCDSDLHCHYSISLQDDAALFTLQRTQEDWLALLQTEKPQGITKAVGLYQEMA